MKPVWQGYLSFGLVTIPIKMYTAIQEHVFGFKLLCSKCHNPIKYKRFCDYCNKEIDWNHVVKGLKLDDGTFFIMTPEKIKELKPEKSDEINIIEFIELDSMDIIYFENHYYIAPSKKSEKSFFLFKKALENKNKAAIGKFIMRDKEYICSISSYQNGLLLTTLNYNYEIRPINKITELTYKEKISPTELKLAEQLITQRTIKKFDIGLFKDTFAEKLKLAIKKGKTKKTSKKRIPKLENKLEITKKEKNLINKLRASLKAPSITQQPIAQAKKR